MDALEMFEQSLMARSKKKGERAKNGSYILDNGLTRRTANILRRAGYGLGDYPGLDIDRLETMILSGEIYNIRNCGKGTVKELCHWISNQKSTQQ